MQHEIKVRAFSRQMVAQFEANSSRGGWRDQLSPDIVAIQDQHIHWCLENLTQLSKAVHGELLAGEDQRAAIIEAAADVANMALIVADCANAIKYLPEDMV